LGSKILFDIGKSGRPCNTAILENSIGKVSALGFGAMRFPTLSGEGRGGDIDEPEALCMVRHAIDSGVNYVDTAYPITMDERSGGGQGVTGWLSRKVRLATKLPVWMVTEPQILTSFSTSSSRSSKRTTSILPAACAEQGPLARYRAEAQAAERAEAALADGRIRHLGFSFHDDYAGFEEIVNGSELWSFCQIQLNYMDAENQAGVRGLKLAASKGLAVVVMEPLMGGRLADPPKDIRAAMKAFQCGGRRRRGLSIGCGISRRSRWC